MSKSFEQIFSESNPHGFGGYEGPCTCCEPKSTDKVTKAYARGVQDERERIIKLLEEMPWQIYQAVALDGKILESVSMPKVFNRDDVLAIIKGENK